ncbi:50S ribosomal protein L32 [Enterobacterales bacterium endosymbiont of Anomoneura mori]|uniref:50S ribosomal protein L32 n=1 Tax=Enterobacterales bacterium endosymbiont of Anomoneura mori TaxID=3132096 RepID=UPI00399CE48B
MAVPKHRISRSKRNMRRSHDKLKFKFLSIDKKTKELHFRHNITLNGFYKGIKVIK